jgi:cell division protein FtsN
VRAQLALQGIESRIHQVSVNDVTRHRVWVGPTTDLALLNRTRDQLRAAGRDVILLTMRE